MSDTEEKYEWHPKNYRPEEDILSELHPAWLEFLQIYFPATEHEEPEYLTTSQVMDLIDAIQDSCGFSEQSLYVHLKKAGFKQLLPPPAGVFLWMVKDTAMKMISAPVL